MAIDRARGESEYPSEVRAAGARGRSLYDKCVAALMRTGYSELDASMIVTMRFPELLAQLAPDDDKDESEQGNE